MNKENYIPQEILEWRERNKHLLEGRNKKPLHEILQNLNEWIEHVEKLTGDRNENK